MVLAECLTGLLDELFIKLDGLDCSLSNFVIFSSQIIDELVESILIELFSNALDFRLLLLELGLLGLLESLLFLLLLEIFDLEALFLNLFGALFDLGLLLFAFFFLLLLLFGSEVLAFFLILVCDDGIGVLDLLSHEKKLFSEDIILDVLKVGRRVQREFF